MNEKLKNLLALRAALLGKMESFLNAEEKDQTDEARALFNNNEQEVGKIGSQIDEVRRQIAHQKRQAEEKLEQELEEQRSSEPSTPRAIGDPANRGESVSDTKDIHKFSLHRLCQRLAGGQALDGIEAEMAQEGLKEARESGFTPQGTILSKRVVSPGKMLNQRDMTATGGTNLQQGGMTIETDKGSLIDSLFESLVFSRAGAQMLTGLVGNIDLPRIVKGTAPAQKSEQGSADEYSPTTAQLSLSPKRLPSKTQVSKQLLLQSSNRSLDAFLERHINILLRSLIESRTITGNGGTSPVGILNTAAIGAVVGGTNGAAPDWDDIVELETKVATENADIGNLFYLSNAKVRGKLKRTPKALDTNSDAVDSMFILDDRNGGPLNGYDQLWTNNVPSDLTKGGSSGICSAIIFGNFLDLVMAQWGGVEILVDPFTGAETGTTNIHAAVYYDGGVTRPESFAAMKDVLTS